MCNRFRSLHNLAPIQNFATIMGDLDMRQAGDDYLIIYRSGLMQVRPVNRAMNRSSVRDVTLIDTIDTARIHHG